MTEIKTGRTKPIPTDDPHHSLEVIWSGDGKRIVSDHRRTGKKD